MSVFLFIYKYLIKIKKKIKIRVIESLFRKNAIIGDSFSISESARIQNDSGDRKCITIGKKVEFLGVLLSEGGSIEIGDYSTVRADTRICSVNNITIGKYVIISNNVVIQDNNSHPIDVSIRKKMSIEGPGTELWKSSYSQNAPIIIEDSVCIGEKSYVLKGVKIGTGSIVACNSVVTKDVPPNCIVAGNPARVVKYL